MWLSRRTPKPKNAPHPGARPPNLGGPPPDTPPPTRSAYPLVTGLALGSAHPLEGRAHHHYCRAPSTGLHKPALTTDYAKLRRGAGLLHVRNVGSTTTRRARPKCGQQHHHPSA